MTELNEKLLERPLSELQLADVWNLAKYTSLAIWASYSDEFGYFKEKREHIESMQPMVANIEFMVGMFDGYNIAAWVTMVDDLSKLRKDEFAPQWLRAWAFKHALPQAIDGIAMFESLEGK